MKVLLFVLLAIFALKSMSISAQERHEQFIIKTDYLVSLPKTYKDDLNKKWPVLVFLHGSRRNSTIEKVKNDFLPVMFSKDEKSPLILISPVNADNKWNIELLNKLLDDVIDKYNVDKNRIYLSGHSLGGWGAWEWALKSPERFAAIVPISGCVREEIKAPWKLRHLPIWVFHGRKDELVNADCNINAVKLLQKYSDKAKITIYPDVGHDTWALPFTKNNVITWLLEQNSSSNNPKSSQLDPNSYQLYTGQYLLADSPKDTVEVIYKDSQLCLTFNRGKHVIALSPETKTRFYVDSAPWAGVEFIIDDNKTVGLNILEHRLKAYSKLNIDE